MFKIKNQNAHFLYLTFDNKIFTYNAKKRNFSSFSKNARNCKVFLIKNINYNFISKRNMFSFKNTTKKLKNMLIPVQKKLFSNQPQQKQILNSSNEEKEIPIKQASNDHTEVMKNATLLHDLYTVTFDEVQYPFYKELENHEYIGFVLTKAYHLIQKNGNVLGQKKLLHYFSGKIKPTKKDIFNILSDIERLKFPGIVNKEIPYFILEDNETASLNNFYEIFVSKAFARSQPYVHSIKFNSERPASRSSYQENLSKKFTGQKYNDIEVTFNAKLKNFVISIFDIKIGNRTHFKGNLNWASLDDTKKCYTHIASLENEILEFIKNYAMSETEETILKTASKDIQEIKNISNMTIQNKVLLIQQKIIEIKDVMRTYNPYYNPNFLCFIPESIKTSSTNSSSDLDLIKKFSEIPEVASFSSNSTDAEIKAAITKSLSMFLEYRTISLEVMSPTGRKYCYSIIKSFLPHCKELKNIYAYTD